MDYRLNLGVWGSVFAVPSLAVDKFLRLASGTAIKVLLFALRSNERPLNPEEAARAVGRSVDDVEDALAFWIEQGLFAPAGDSLVPSEAGEGLSAPKSFAMAPAAALSLVQDEPPAPSAPAREAHANVTRVRPDKPMPLSPGEIAGRVRTSPEITFLFASAEQSFARPLNHTEQRSLLSLHDWAGLPVDVILMALEYCQSTGRTGIRSVEKIAVSWADMGVNTLDKAEVLIRELKERNEILGRIKAVFGINRSLTPKERDYIERWVGEFHASFPLIRLAYERTVDNTGKISFAYMNTILDAWNKKGIKTVEAALDEASSYKKQTGQAASPSYDLEEFEKLALARTPKPEVSR